MDASLSAIVSASALPMSYSLFQDGYAEGATVTGMITVEDVDNNGQIAYIKANPVEVTALTLNFSGNSAIPAFSADLTSVTGTQWDLDPIYGDGTGGSPGIYKEGLNLYVNVGGTIYQYETGFSPLGSVFPIKGQITNLKTGGAAETENFLMASSIAVPDGGMTLALLGAALVGLATLRRRLA